MKVDKGYKLKEKLNHDQHQDQHQKLLLNNKNKKQTKTKKRAKKLKNLIQKATKKTSVLTQHNNNSLQTSTPSSLSSTSTNSLITNLSIDNYLLDDNDEYDTYRIGDWVYCEFEPDQPYSIRRIEEFSTNLQTNQIELKLRCAFRRNDISQSLLNIVEKRYFQYFTSIQSTLSFSSLKTQSKDLLNLKDDDDNLYMFIKNLPQTDINQLKQRELFYSRYSESNVPITHLRGKLNLTLFQLDVNHFDEYLNNNNTTTTTQDKFFYHIIYDPNQRILSADKPHIREGHKYQADIPDLLLTSQHVNEHYSTKTNETLIFNGPESCTKITDLSMKKYLKRLIDSQLDLNEKKFKNCELIQSRDLIMYDALINLNNCLYDRKRSFDSFFSSASLTSQSVKVWTENEMCLFKNGLSKYGKDFHRIKYDLRLENKSVQDLVEYYYNIWKITDDYIKLRDEKRLKKSKKLTEITIPKSLSQFINLTLTHEQNDLSLNNNNNNSHNLNITNRQICISCQKLKLTNQFNRLNTNESSKYKSKLEYDNKTNVNQSKTQIELFKLSDINSTSNSSVKQQQQQQRDDLNCIEKKSNRNDDTNLCNQCWIYWKKYACFKQINESTTTCKLNDLTNEQIRQMNKLKRLDRIEKTEMIKTLVYKCSQDECGRKEFKKLNDLKKHCFISHCLTIKKPCVQPIEFKDVAKFSMRPTILTRQLRINNLNYLKKLARQPCKIKFDLNKCSKMNTKLVEINNKKNLQLILNKNKSKTQSKQEKQYRLDNLLNQLESNKFSLTYSSSRPLTPLSCDCNYGVKKLDNLLNEDDCIIISPSPSPSPQSLSIKTLNETKTSLYPMLELSINMTFSAETETDKHHDDDYKRLRNYLCKLKEPIKKATVLCSFGFNKYNDWYFKASNDVKKKRFMLLNKNGLKKLARCSFKNKNDELFFIIQNEAIQSKCKESLIVTNTNINTNTNETGENKTKFKMKRRGKRKCLN